MIALHIRNEHIDTVHSKGTSSEYGLACLSIGLKINTKVIQYSRRLVRHSMSVYLRISGVAEYSRMRSRRLELVKLSVLT
jgi:hypothetical protein